MTKVTGKSVRRPRHIPQRTCVGCRAVMPKRSLIRLVRRPEGVQVDPSGKLAGRGAYIHDRRACWEKGLKGALAHALKTTLSPENLNALRQFAQSLPEDEEDVAVEA